MKELLLVCIIAAVASGAFYGIGTGLTRLLRLPATPALFSVFLRLVFGTSAVIVIYALARTGGNTVMAGVILMLGGMAYQLRQGAGSAMSGVVLPGASGISSKPTTSAGSLLALVVSVTIAMTALRFPLLYNLDTKHYDAPFVDFVYYAKLAFQLNKLGVETTSFIPGTLAPLSPQPYHYFELWLNALLVWATPLAPGVSLFIVTYSLLLVIVYFGFCALFEHFEQPRGRALLLGGSCLFIVGVFLPFFFRSSILYFQSAWLQLYLFVRPKLAPVYVFMLLGFLLYVRGNKKAALWAWATIPLVNIATAPAMLMASGFLCIGLTVSNKGKLSNFFRLLLPAVVSALFIGSFYLLNSRLHQQLSTPPAAGSDVPFSTMLTKPSEWHTSFNVVAGTLLAFAAYYFLYAGLLLGIAWPKLRIAWINLKPYSGLVWLVLTISGSGALVVGTFFHFIDAGQFFDNTATVSIAVLFALIAAVLLRGRSPQRAYLLTAGVGALVVINLYSDPAYFSLNNAPWWRHLPLTAPQWPQHRTTNYNPAFLDQVTQLVPKIGSVGATIRDTADYISRYHYNPDLFTPGLYLSTTLSHEAIWLSLSHLALDSAKAVRLAPNYKLQMRNWTRQGAIQTFARQQRAQNPNLSNEAIQRKFVLSQHINFICTTPKVELPASIKPLVQKVLTDNVSGEKLYLLNVK